MGAHDQHSTTVYSLNDRYRGIEHGRFVIFVSPDYLTELDLCTMARSRHLQRVAKPAGSGAPRLPGRVVSHCA
jgi:hypothetical protein